VIDGFVLSARAPLLDFADQLNVVYFNDPARVRQLVGQIATSKAATDGDQGRVIGS